MPIPPVDTSVPIYEIGDGIFLVDETGGTVSIGSAQTNSQAVAAFVSKQGDQIANLIEQVGETETERSMAESFGADIPFPGGSGGGPNDLSTGVSGPTIADYGTNLWIAETGITNGFLTAIGSNTLTGVRYVIESVTNLAQGNWQYEGMIVGSFSTNWTPLSVSQLNRQNLFIRLVSDQSSDGSGIPDWWEQQYGLSNVDANAQDSAGDGYTIYQKYVLGVNPNTWLTPVAPGNVAVNFLAASAQANVQWQASMGNVVGYQVEKTYEAQGANFYYVYSTNDIDVSSNSLSLDDDVSGQTSDDDFDFPGFNDFYKVRAHYANGLYSDWSAKTPLKTSFPSASLVYGAGGQACIALTGVPSGTTAIRFFYQDYDAFAYYGESPINFSNDVPYNLFTNGIYALPDSLQPPTSDAYGPCVQGYIIYAQAVDTNGDASDYAYFYQGLGWDQPFYDGRLQLKQNLIFKLRAADVDKPFRFYYGDTNDSDAYFAELYYPPTNHVESSLMHVTDILTDTNYLNPYDYYAFHRTLIDPQLPFFENYLYYNFADVSANVDAHGVLDTGVGYDGYADMELSSSPAWRFQAPTGTWTNLPGLLDESSTAYFSSLPLYNPVYSLYSYLYENDVTPNGNGSFSFAFGAKNLYGLQFLDEKLVGHDISSGSVNVAYTLIPGDTSPEYTFDDGPVLYAGTAQPSLETVEYDFWNPIPVWNPGISRWVEPWLPGSQYFSPTNQSQEFIVGVGSTVQVAGYAKMALLNGYSGVYAYLGQYFDQAYQASNNLATATPTGVLSPYGNFYATQPGDAALVTLPDIDTGERGTVIVHCVSMQVDKNHDGTMDTSLNGPDMTSQSSPMEFWVNNGNDQPDTTTAGGLDTDSPVPPAPPNYAPSQFYPIGNISCKRDLENFARLWIRGMPALGNRDQVTLSWSNVIDAPAINLYNSVETNGGIGYLSNTNIAANQCLAHSISTNYDSVDFVGPSIAIASITTNRSFTFPANSFTNAGDQYFLFEGAGIGTGELVMTITDQNSNVVAQTGVWLDLHDVKDFYERAAIAVNTSGAVSNWSSSITGIQAQKVFIPNEDTNIFVYVHGGANDEFSWLDRSDTIFKRLYWAGYQGRLATVRWPSPVKSEILSIRLEWFNQSELIAYKAASSLKIYLSEVRSNLPNFQLDLLPQSLGGIVVGEALHEGAPFNNLILLQNAVSASAYDPNAPTNADLMAEEEVDPSPNEQPWGYRGVYTNFPTGHIANYYNTNDAFLNLWTLDQEHYKNVAPAFTYDGTYSYAAGELITDPQYSRSYVARSRTLAIGEQAPVTGQTTQGVVTTSLDLHGQFGVGTSGDEHSAFYSRPIQSILPLYSQFLFQIQPIP